jgi:hypothetical protein
VVSHVPIFEEQLLRKPDFDWQFSNAYFGNITLGKHLVKKRKVGAVVSGHTHIGMEGVVQRPVLDGGPLPVFVLGSDYHSPTYSVIDTEALDARTPSLWS